MPPEFFADTPYYGSGIDWFQVGICAYEVVTGVTPFQGCPLVQIDTPLYPPEWPEHVQDETFKNLVDRLLHPDETRRISRLDDVKRYMPDIDWQNIESTEPITLMPFSQATLLVDPDGNLDLSSTPSEGFVVPRLLSGGDDEEGDGVGEQYDTEYNDPSDDPLYFKSFTFTRNM
jgi:serine/threonine protein kinase